MALINNLLIYLFFIYVCNLIYKYNIKNKTKDDKANPGIFSLQGSYKNISPFKHDVYKQWTCDILPLIIISIIPKNNLSFIESTFGSLLISALSYFVYYHINEPYIVNYLPNF